MPAAEPRLRSQRLRMVNYQGDALRLGMRLHIAKQPVLRSISLLVFARHRHRLLCALAA